MCRSRSYALQLALDHHPDSRSWALWSTRFDEVGQGSLWSDVHNFADDDAGRQALAEHIALVAAGWAAGFSIKTDRDPVSLAQAVQDAMLDALAEEREIPSL